MASAPFLAARANNSHAVLVLLAADYEYDLSRSNVIAKSPPRAGTSDRLAKTADAAKVSPELFRTVVG